MASEGVPLTQFGFKQIVKHNPLRSQVLRDNVVSRTDRLHLSLESDLVGYIAKKAVVPIDSQNMTIVWGLLGPSSTGRYQERSYLLLKIVSGFS